MLFNGHIDVVTVEPRDQWTSDPWRATVRDGKLYGRGACDMKGGIAAMVFAAEVLATLGLSASPAISSSAPSQTKDRPEPARWQPWPMVSGPMPASSLRQAQET